MEKGALAVEKRRHPRVDLEVTVRFRRLAQDEKEEAVTQFQQAQTKDVSQSGIALVQTQHLDSGDLIKLEIDLPGRDKPVKAYSEVMWIRPPGAEEKVEIAGIQFMGLKPEDEAYLAGLVEQALQRDDGSDDDEGDRTREKEFIRKIGKLFSEKE